MQIIDVSKNNIRNCRISHLDKNITLHSIDPVKEAERIVSNFNKDMKWVLIVGPGLWHIPEYIIKNTNFKLIVFEISKEIFEYAQKYDEVNEILNDSRVRFVLEDLDKLFDLFEEERITEMNYYISRSYSLIFQEIVNKIEGLLIAYISKKNINRNTLQRFQKVWLKNIIKNFNFYFRLPGVKNISRDLENKPALIIGAGPSLEKNIVDIEKYQENFVIIATDTITGKLLDNNIEPDFIVSVDPQDKNALYLFNLDLPEKTKIIMEASASFLILSKIDHKKIVFFDSIFPIYRELIKDDNRKGDIKCGGSVSNACFDFARFLGCNPIVLIGQDLSYTNNYTHAQGNILEKNLYTKINRFYTYDNYNTKSLLGSDRIQVEGIKGYVNSDRKFITYLDWFVKEIKKTDKTVINATYDGVIIKGAIHLDFIEVVNKYCNKKIDKIYKIIFNNNKDMDHKNFTDEFNRTLRTIDELIVKAKKALEAAKMAMINYRKNKPIDIFFKDMNNFDLSLLKQENFILAKILELTMQETIEIIIKMAENEKKRIDEEMINNWINLYEKSIDGLNYSKNLIRKYLKINENLL